MMYIFKEKRFDISSDFFNSLEDHNYSNKSYLVYVFVHEMRRSDLFMHS